MNFKGKVAYECDRHGTQWVDRWIAEHDTISEKCPVCQALKAMPARYREAQLSDFDEDVVGAVSGWMDGGPKDNLLVLGPVGTGKTHLAAAICGECGSKGIPAEYWLSSEISNQIMRDREIGKFGTTQLLIIDEIGRTYETQAEADRFFALVNARYNNMLPTVFMGNIEKNMFKTTIGEAAADRIRDAVTIIAMKGESKRGTL